MDRFKVSQGASLPIPAVTIRDSGGNAITTYTGTEALATEIWPGGNREASFSIATSWATPAAGTITVGPITASDTTGLALGVYEGLTRLTPSGQDPVDVYRFSLEILPYVGTETVATVPDLITQDYLEMFLPENLTTRQLAALPALTKAASRAIRRHCNRFFNRGGPNGVIPAYDGLYTLEWPSKTILLRHYPLNAPPVVRSSPTIVLTLWQNDTTTNQQAYAYFATDGTVEDVDDVSPKTTGLTLVSIASAVTTTTTLNWSSYPTLTALATAIAALDAGWETVIEDGFDDWPTADFRAGQGAQPCLGYESLVGFSVHATVVPSIYNARSGMVTLSEQINDPFASPRFGLYLETDLDDVTVYGGPQGLRVVYDAGWTTIPEDVQDACVETVLDWLWKKSLDQNLGSESDGARSIVLNTAFANYALPKSVLGKLARYRSPRS